jgi:hypothetical protein
MRDIAEEEARLRVARWFSTYNSAVVALGSRLLDNVYEDGVLIGVQMRRNRELHRLCTEVADDAHGQLSPKAAPNT